MQLDTFEKRLTETMQKLFGNNVIFSYTMYRDNSNAITLQENVIPYQYNVYVSSDKVAVSAKEDSFDKAFETVLRMLRSYTKKEWKNKKDNKEE